MAPLFCKRRGIACLAFQGMLVFDTANALLVGQVMVRVLYPQSIIGFFVRSILQTEDRKSVDINTAIQYNIDNILGLQVSKSVWTPFSSAKEDFKEAWEWFVSDFTGEKK